MSYLEHLSCGVMFTICLRNSRGLVNIYNFKCLGMGYAILAMGVFWVDLPSQLENGQGQH